MKGTLFKLKMEREIKKLKHEAQKSHVEYLTMKKDRKLRKVTLLLSFLLLSSTLSL